MFCFNETLTGVSLIWIKSSLLKILEIGMHSTKGFLDLNHFYLGLGGNELLKI